MTTTVDVLWVSWHDDVLARGYYDEGFLEQMLDRRVWRPSGALSFEHHEVRGDFPDVRGALVVLPARHHAGEHDVARLLENLERLEWSVVVLAGDEEWAFPVEAVLETETRRVWIMQPQPVHAKYSGLIPGGWYPDTPQLVRAANADPFERDLDWFFAGQVTHNRRAECVNVIRDLPRGVLHETQGYLQGMPREEYAELLVRAKVVPCPSGPMTVDTARPLEAMEAGCVPVVDLVTPRGDHYDYWSLCFGEDCPLPRLYDWAAFPDELDAVLKEWPAPATRISAWWQQYKRRITHQLDDDLRAVMALDVCGAPRTTKAEHNADCHCAPDDLVTVIIPTSPIASHPSTEIIEFTVDSVREQFHDAEIVIVADGVRPEQGRMRDAYEEYLQRLVWLTNHHWHNVVPLVLDEWGHQANATRAALELVRTPLVFFCEHDTPVKGDVPWRELCDVVMSGEANVVRLHHEDRIFDEHRHLMVDDAPSSDPPLLRTVAWWQRPHLASARFYRDKVMALFPKSSRTMLEDRLYGLVQSEYLDHGEPAWWEWRLFIYAPAGDMQRSFHLDGRDGAEKYEMRF